MPPGQRHVTSVRGQHRGREDTAAQGISGSWAEAWHGASGPGCPPLCQPLALHDWVPLLLWPWHSAGCRESYLLPPFVFCFLVFFSIKACTGSLTGPQTLGCSSSVPASPTPQSGIGFEAALPQRNHQAYLRGWGAVPCHPGPRPIALNPIICAGPARIHM